MNLTTAHLEHGLAILADLDGASVSEALAKLGPVVTSGTAVPLADLLGIALPFLRAAGSAGRGRILRRLSAVARATVDELLDAEADPKKLAAMERAAALRPYEETFQDAIGFFSAFGLTLPSTPCFSEVITAGAPSAAPVAEGSPSAD